MEFKPFNINRKSIEDSFTLKDKSRVIDISNKRLDSVYNRDEAIRLINTSDSSYQSYHDWYILDDGLYYYKNIDIFSELLLSELIKEFNLKCVEFSIASNNNRIGIISKNFREQGTIYNNYSQFCNSLFDKDFVSGLSNLNNSMSNVINDESRNRIINDLSRLIVFDFFSGQADRGVYNVYFSIKDSSIKLSPQTDNGTAFKNYNLDHYSSCVQDLLFPSTKYVTCEEYETLLLITKNQEFRDYLLKCLDIDIESIIKRTLSKYNLLLNKEAKSSIMSYFDEKKKIIDKSLSLIRKKN